MLTTFFGKFVYSENGDIVAATIQFRCGTAMLPAGSIPFMFSHPDHELAVVWDNLCFLLETVGIIPSDKNLQQVVSVANSLETELKGEWVTYHVKDRTRLILPKVWVGDHDGVADRLGLSG